MPIHWFEDLVAWQRPRALVREVYLLTRLPAFSRDFGLSSQIRRSAVSVMANIAEGFDKNRSTEFGRYLDYAEFDRIGGLVDAAEKVIAGLRRSLARPPGDPAPGTGH